MGYPARVKGSGPVEILEVIPLIEGCSFQTSRRFVVQERDTRLIPVGRTRGYFAY